ncbi:ribonuclease VapC [Spirochaetia bacterium]|nr:ribonuclease VapC [Spirochaetia bacterium]
MILVDTSVWIDYFNGVDAPHTDLLDHELQHDRLVTGDLIIAELLQGFGDEKDLLAAKRIMDSLEYYDLSGYTIAVQSAVNYRNLRRHGITVRKTIDMIIGTFCVTHGFPLLHNDRDFDLMAGTLGLQILKSFTAE